MRVGTQETFALVVDQHEAMTKAHLPCWIIAEFAMLKRFLELLLLRIDKKASCFLFFEEVLQLDFLELQVLAPVSNSTFVAILEPTSELLWSELHFPFSTAAANF
jgi:hypothetical protein